MRKYSAMQSEKHHVDSAVDIKQLRMYSSFLMSSSMLDAESFMKKV